MSTSVSKKSSDRMRVRAKRRKRIRSRLTGTSERPRLCIFRSNQHFMVQMIDDIKGHTLVSASTLEEDLRKKSIKATVEGAKTLGEVVAKRAAAKSISQVVFDRSGYLYHGRIKAFADAARNAGLQF